MDESSKQLVGEVHMPIPCKPGQPKRVSERKVWNIPSWSGNSNGDVEGRIVDTLYSHFYDGNNESIISPPISLEELQLIDKHKSEILDTLYLIEGNYIYTEDELKLSFRVAELLINYFKSIDPTNIRGEQFEELYRLSAKTGMSYKRFDQIFIRAEKALETEWESKSLNMIAPHLTSEEISIAKKYTKEIEAALSAYHQAYSRVDQGYHPRHKRNFLWKIFN